MKRKYMINLIELNETQVNFLNENDFKQNGLSYYNREKVNINTQSIIKRYYYGGIELELVINLGFNKKDRDINIHIVGGNDKPSHTEDINNFLPHFLELNYQITRDLVMLEMCGIIDVEEEKEVE